MKRMAAILAALGAFALPASAIAQSYQCRLPERISLPRITADGPVRVVPVTGYTAALSWSPEFCKDREMQPRHAVQCSGSNGRFGLVMHGLWPQGRCAGGEAAPSRAAGGAGPHGRSMCAPRRLSLIIIDYH